MAHDIFISYSSKDKPIADGICANLEAAGFRCWIAPRDIAPGDDWPTAITSAITESKIMVLVFSANSNSSKDVGREIILAANENLTIIPFKIEDVKPEPGKQYYLARTHWLEAMNPPTREHIQALIERVRVLVPPVAESGIVQPSAVSPPAQELLPVQPPSTSQEPGRTPEPVIASPERKEPVPKTPVKKTWFRREFLYIGVPILLVFLGVLIWPRIQGMTNQPEVFPTAITTLAQTPQITNTSQPTSTDAPAATSTEQVSSPTPGFHYSLLKTLTGHTNEVMSVAFSNDGQTLASGSRDLSIILWDVASGEMEHILKVHTNTVNRVVFHPTLDDLMVSSSDDGRILLWSYRNGYQVGSPLSGQTGGVRSLVFSKDGHYLASGANDSTIVLWNFQNYANSGQVTKLHSFSDRSSFVLSLAFNPNADILASGGYQESTILIHDMNGDLKLTLEGGSDDVESLEFSPDKSMLASATHSGTVNLWDTSTWKKLNPTRSGVCVAFSPDGRILAIGSRDGSISVVEVVTGKVLVSIQAHPQQEIKDLAFSPDGSMLASGAVDGLVKIWELDY